MDSDFWTTFDYEHLWHPFTQTTVWKESRPLVIEKASGAELIDIDGRHYLDAISSLWCNVHGHSHPVLVRAMHEQLDLLCHSTLLGLAHRPILELTKKLLEHTPTHLTRAFYADSGSTAVEAALRMAREWWRKNRLSKNPSKHKIASLAGGYHGDTLGAVQAGYLPEFHESLAREFSAAPRIQPPHYFRFFQGLSGEEALEASLTSAQTLFTEHADKLAACIVEPLVQGAAGMWIHPPEFLEGIAELCKRRDVLLIVDEVATGFGKTGKMFACDHCSVKPDILILAKGLSAGYLPISVALTTESIFDGFTGEPEELKTFFYGQTFAGNPLAASVACANLDLFTPDFFGSINERIAALQQLLNEHILPLAHVDEVRSFGIMTGIELTKIPGARAPYPPNDRAGIRVTLEARKRGVIVRPLGNVMVLMPPLSMTLPQLSTVVEVLRDSMIAALGN